MIELKKWKFLLIRSSTSFQELGLKCTLNICTNLSTCITKIFFNYIFILYISHQRSDIVFFFRKKISQIILHPNTSICQFQCYVGHWKLIEVFSLVFLPRSGGPFGKRERWETGCSSGQARLDNRPFLAITTSQLRLSGNSLKSWNRKCRHILVIGLLEIKSTLNIF